MADGKSLANKLRLDSKKSIRPHLTTYFPVPIHQSMQNPIVETMMYCGKILELYCGSYADGKSLAIKLRLDSKKSIRPHLTTYFPVPIHQSMQNPIVETMVYCGNILELYCGSYGRR